MKLTRRGLGFGLLGGVVLACLGLPLTVYRPWADEDRFLLAAMDALFPHGGDLPDPAEIGAPAAVRAYLDRLPPSIALQARGLFFAIETGTVASHGRSFSRLSREERTGILADWAGSNLTFRRLMVHALKQTCAMGYWQHPSTWAHLGYDGPLVSQ
ncbi:MAG: gluconate 2-dehydrogenase subunit 3 family protein [Deltaproteobacteria bacterium]|nr:gluconate 2-dehydrogenase subunit 3 family protein [Deltaproteobacteria bacterium]MBW2255215.1 gluconate 2-dehydrogenase subunit 3 family protein [Deltaproteobacteria bacterium]